MTYSSALFDGDPRAPLEASRNRRSTTGCSGELALAAGAHVLEIGCGWGGFAETAARAGHRVTGHLAVATRRPPRRASASRARDSPIAPSSDLMDYRDVRGTFDAVASIEMVEAVGETLLARLLSRRCATRSCPAAARACRRSRSPTTASSAIARSPTSSSSTSSPAACSPSPSRLVAEARARRPGLVRVAHASARDYAETLRALARRLRRARRVDARAGFDERFVRCWRFYLAYCAAGFATGTTDVGQYTFDRA